MCSRGPTPHRSAPPSGASSRQNGSGRTLSATGRPGNKSRNKSRRSWDDMAVRGVFVRSKSPAGGGPPLAEEAGSVAPAGYERDALVWDRDLAHPKEKTRERTHID